MSDLHPSPTPTTPGLYIDATGEVWRVRNAGEPCRPATFDELLEHAITQPAEQAARSGPFLPLLALTVAKQDLLLEALAELRYETEDRGTTGPAQEQSRRDDLTAIRTLANEIEALG